MLATLAHSRQVDKIGRPYIEHPMQVAAYAVEMLPAYEWWKDTVLDPNRAAVIGMLHDTVEDTWVTEEILSGLFPPSVPRDVNVLTFVPTPGKVHREERDLYLQGILDSAEGDKCHYPLLVKIADLRHNTDRQRIQRVAERDGRGFERLTRKYRADCEYLGLYAADSPFSEYFEHLPVYMDAPR